MRLSTELREAAGTVRYRVTKANGGRTINVRAYLGKKVVGRMGASQITPSWYDMGALVVDEMVQRQGVAT